MTVSVDVVEGIEEMTIACNEGTHEPADNITNVICLQDKWIPFIPKCRPNPCKVPELNNGHYHTPLLGRIQSGTEMEHGQTIYAKCENGYETTKFYFTSCKYGEFKNIENISCVEKSCKPLKKLTNGTFDKIGNGGQLSWIPGTKTKVICENGFIPKNGITNVTCQRGRWQPDEPSCIPKYCLLPFIPNGYFLYRNHKQIQDKLIKNGTAIKTFCDSNHNLSGPKAIVCSYGKWLPEVPACQKYFCIPLTNSTTSPLVLNTHHRKRQEIGSVSLYQDQLHPHGTVVKLVCDPSKYKSKNGVTTSTCLNGKWTVTDLECQPFSCLQLKNDSVSSPLTLIGSTSRLMLHSSTVELHCNPQTTIPLNNNIRSVCQYGKWIPSLLECKPRSCVLPEFKETSYRFLNDEPVVNFTIPSGTYIHVICDKPHLIPTVVLCHYGKWVLPVRSCFDGSCYISQNENIDFWTDMDSGEINFKNYVHNSTSIKISCKLNSRLMNGTVNKFTCLEGEWSPYEPFCEKKPAKAPKLLRTNSVCKHPEQGDNVVFVWDNVDSKYNGNSFIANGTSFHARCTDVGNFQLLGSNFLSCQNGIWYGKLPVCQKTEEDESAPPRIYINITTTWSDERTRYVVTANGSVVINAGDRLQLGCSHNLYETKDLEWVPPNDSIPTPESIPESIASNVTGIRLHISHFTPNNVGQYICRIKDSSLFHFVNIIL
ncbi:sushi, von Willebrand factor type A, EGF and pentraxin domain-containing protein 1-like [Octopus bimaculoides]|uniref:sushi, von Willebrand factor type A, EGF and pentraxin domain-containing protein 1-like n=1 Tax=Octopus bimaculoides TaxID=37653 RepID=UPI0022E5413F|nr:sushi, von Willebrand factor type A, EGF and pentraxin domain-containing protein 1-like [Octopus bimaculoides]